MSLKNLSNFVTSKAGRQILKVRKHSPALLFAAGVVGFAATVVLASRATMKLHDVLDEHEAEIEGAKKIADELEQYSDSDHKKDLAKIHVKTGLEIAKLYAPAVLVGAASIAALTGSHVVLNRRYAGATAAYAALHKGFEQYRERVREKFGQETDNEMRHGVEYREIVEETDQGPKVTVIKHAKRGEPSGYAVWFDARSKNFQRDAAMNVNFLRSQQVFLNEKLRANGHLFLNEVYDALDLPRSQAGSQVGWIKDADAKGEGDGYVSFVDPIINGETQAARDFWNGLNREVLIDFNVDGVIWNKI